MAVFFANIHKRPPMRACAIHTWRRLRFGKCRECELDNERESSSTEDKP